MVKKLVLELGIRDGSRFDLWLQRTTTSNENQELIKQVALSELVCEFLHLPLENNLTGDSFMYRLMCVIRMKMKKMKKM